MPKSKLFDNWTWNRNLPMPFDALTDNKRTDVYSRYNTMSKPKATIHFATLSAILEYMEMDTTVTPGSTSASAIGTQGDMVIAEYKSRMNEIHCVIFNQKTGKFTSSRFDDPDSSTKVYSLKETGNSGTALFLALMPEALADDEFNDEYAKLADCKKSGYPDIDEAAKAAAVLCDNIYRRITSSDVLTNAGIKLNIPATGNIAQITPLNLKKGTYSPTNILFGDFKILKPHNASSIATVIKKEDFISQYRLSERTFSRKEQSMIPEVADWYVIPSEVESICKHAKLTSTGIQPMRNFMLRGRAGTGKTESAKAIAAGLGLPYLYFTCSANTEIFDMLGQMLPDTDHADVTEHSLPSLEDIQMDPPSAYYKLTGEYMEDVTDALVYDKLLEVMRENARKENGTSNQGQRFKYVETPLITAIKNGYVIELQEPSIIANPGVLVGLNALLDRCGGATLPTGETIKRHPDTVIIVTTNNDYAGCRDINQSVISRMNLVMDIEEPDVDTLTKRAMNITGCTDQTNVTLMAQTLKEINEHCRQTMIADGSCGVRELIAWVQSYMILNDIMQAAEYTILSSATADPENREEIKSTCLEEKFAA